MNMAKTFFLSLLALCLARSVCNSQGKPESRVVHLSNNKIDFGLTVSSKKIVSSTLSVLPAWGRKLGTGPTSLTADADFALEIMWTDWQAPKMINNAENPVLLTSQDFLVEHIDSASLGEGKKELQFLLEGNGFPLQVRLIFQMDRDKFYLRQRLEVIDTSDAGHFLQRIWPLREKISQNCRIIKNGGFGQPVAIESGTGGMFFGMEYPAADNNVLQDQSGLTIMCGQEVGEKITPDGYRSESIVQGICPDTLVKLWFMRYVDDIRVAPLKPYTLYNSWYDLRSPEYRGVPDANVMNEKNIFRIIGLIKKNMIEKHHISLDAFVLDDGWDVYQSDWVLRKNEFPRGLKPIAEELSKTKTSLGMWLGPTGGYSFRMKRVNWMKDHGYEVVGHTPNTAMMCLAGKNYSALFRKRTTDFVRNEGVGYFKWDGIQFSCSESDHGHPVGIYSRRAVMESVIDKCKAVREINPNMFLNITSGTWLSPWWVKYANQIWMQGEDYGYADVPSLSPRDAAITYRDLSLYEDFRKNGFWFPIQNLMTHGIIKGNLEKLGGEAEPLDKFTNEVLLYFARGVSMWELYISPDILSDGEWDAMAGAIRWARDRFPILSTTEMVGGDPKSRESYAYVHFKGKDGIIAARNPWIVSDTLRVDLLRDYGIGPDADSLVLERVYPDRWISPRLYALGSRLELPLTGYETAIYELHPLSEKLIPLVAGCEYEIRSIQNNSIRYSLYPTTGEVRLLSTNKSTALVLEGKTIDIGTLQKLLAEGVKRPQLSIDRYEADSTGFDLSVSGNRASGTLAILTTPTQGDEPKRPVRIEVNIDGTVDTAAYHPGEGTSVWYTYPLSPGHHDIRVMTMPTQSARRWIGHMSVWMVTQQLQTGVDLQVTTDHAITESPMPPRPYPAGTSIQNLKIGDVDIRE